MKQFFKWRDEHYIAENGIVISAPNGGYGTIATVGMPVSMTSIPCTGSVQQIEDAPQLAVESDLYRRIEYGLNIWPRNLDIRFDGDLIRVRRGLVVWSNNPRWRPGLPFWPIYVQYDDWSGDNHIEYQDVDMMDRNVNAIMTKSLRSRLDIEPDSVPDIEPAGLSVDAIKHISHNLPHGRMAEIGSHGWPVERVGDTNRAWMRVGDKQTANHFLAYNHILREFPTGVNIPNYTFGMHGYAYQDEDTGDVKHIPTKVGSMVMYHISPKAVSKAASSGALAKHLIMDSILGAHHLSQNKIHVLSSGETSIPARATLGAHEVVSPIFGIASKEPVPDTVRKWVLSLDSNRIAELLNQYGLPEVAEMAKKRCDAWKEKANQPLLFKNHIDIVNFSKSIK